MSEKLKFLDALLFACGAADLDGQEVAYDDFADHLKQENPRDVSPVTPDGLAFVFQAQEQASPDDWKGFTLEPSAALYNPTTQVLIACWALKEPVRPKLAQPLIKGLGMDGADEPVPMPGRVWRLVHSSEAAYSVEKLTRVYGLKEAAKPAPAKPAKDEAPPWEEDAPRYGDARVLVPYNDQTPAMAEEMIISIGKNVDSKHWKPTAMPRGQFVAMLCQHREGTKDGMAFVCGDQVPGRRLKTAVKSLHAVGLDLDNGTPFAQIETALKKLGALAVVYTTHSHHKTVTEFKKDTLTKWIDKECPDGSVEDDATLRRYLAEVEQWDPSIVSSASFNGMDHQDRGIVVAVRHKPMPKHRIVLPFAKPFVISEQAGTQQDAMKRWGKVPTALAQLLGVPLDISCLDPSRLFYFPRHGKGKDFDVALFGGKLFDWNSLELENPWEEEIEKLAKGGSKSKTDGGKSLGRWSKAYAHGFQIVQVLEDHAPERIRHQVAAGVEIECPNDENHSNPGDPEDRACLAVNAGDGPAEVFTISCRHESCQGLTNLDMLGKMVKDGWFAEEVLTDDSYNIAEVEQASDPEAAKKIVREDKAKAEWVEALDSLTESSSSEDANEVLRICLEAKLDDLQMGRVKKRISSTMGVPMASINKAVSKVKSEMADSDIADPLKRSVFQFKGDFNFDEAFDICFKALKKANREAEKPVFCCVQDQAVRMSEDQQGRVTFADLTARSTWAELNERVTFVRMSEEGVAGTRGQVPTDVANQVYEQAYRRLPQAPEIVYTPLFVNSEKYGYEVITEPGWYPDIDLMMANTGFTVPEVSQKPSKSEVDAAITFLTQEMLGDFPFLDHDLQGQERREPSLANALAMILTPFMRRLIDGCTPVFFITKPLPGTGGTFLGMVPIVLCDGEEPAPEPYTQNEEEMRKSLLASIMETRSHLFYDDVREFNNRVLLQSITARHIGGRLLGATKTVQRPNRFNWIATGNNPDVMSEMERRVVWIRLNAQTNDIQKRTFRHPNFMQWLKENREVAVHHILTLVQNWIASGMPKFTERKRASFEDWSEKVGGVLMAAGMENGFLDNRRAMGADANEAAIRTFVREWLDKYGAGSQVSPTELFTMAIDQDMDIADGNNEDQKKARFHRRLPMLNGRTFVVRDESYMVMMGQNADEDTVYSLKVMPKEAVEPEPA